MTWWWWLISNAPATASPRRPQKPPPLAIPTQRPSAGPTPMSFPTRSLSCQRLCWMPGPPSWCVQRGSAFTPGPLATVPPLCPWLSARAKRCTPRWSQIETFHTFVRPRFNPQLSAFCTELTGITQKEVDAAPTFPEAWAQFEAFLESLRFVPSPLPPF
jgi:3'-5' exoribonuclease 1